MQTQAGGIIPVRLFKGEEVHTAIAARCWDAGVRSGFIISGIGMVDDPELGFLVKPGEYLRQRFSGPYELLSLAGNIADYEGDALTHLHATLADREMQAFGGHLFTATVAVTVELGLLPVAADYSMQRRLEAETGLPGLTIDRKS